MLENFLHTEGIILKVIPFRDYDQILTLFTPDAGLMKLFYKGSRNKKRNAQEICIPLTKVEVFYQETNKELFQCQEMKLIDSFYSLRKELMYLEVGCDLLQVILNSQWVGKTALPLYALLCFYLEKITQTVHPWTLAVSFRLKLLHHDGLVTFPFVCSECGEILQTSAYTSESEAWCNLHQSRTHLLPWTESELQHVYQLALCQHYREIQSNEVPKELEKKVAHFFETSVKGSFQ